jgi:general stress protein 26
VSRTVAQRIIDTQHLFASEVDCFFATTNPDGHPNVVPLSVVWHAGVFILCTRQSTRTIRNLRARPFARLVYGTTRNVALVDAKADISDLASVKQSALDSFHRHVGWDIAAEDERYVAITCTPQTIQAWRQEPEATLMDGGEWLA